MTKGLVGCLDGTVHNGDYLVEIYRACPSGIDDEVVYWCKECGATVVDYEIDGIRGSSPMKMKFPKALIDYLNIKKSKN